MGVEDNPQLLRGLRWKKILGTKNYFDERIDFVVQVGVCQVAFGGWFKWQNLVNHV